MNNKAVIAMSGGVDSSVAAYLMKQRGFDCIGVTMKLFANEDIGISREHSCCSLDDVEDARSVAYSLDMPYYVFNFSDRFETDVIDRFINAYENGGCGMRDWFAPMYSENGVNRMSSPVECPGAQNCALCSGISLRIFCHIC